MSMIGPWICKHIVANTLLMCNHFLYVGIDVCLTSPSARHQLTLQDHGYMLMYHAMCLFTLPAFAGYSFQPTHRRRAQAE